MSRDDTEHEAGTRSGGEGPCPEVDERFALDDDAAAGRDDSPAALSEADMLRMLEEQQVSTEPVYSEGDLETCYCAAGGWSSPFRELSIFELGGLLKTSVDRGGSELHIKQGSAPLIRLDGILTLLPEVRSLTTNDAKTLCLSALNRTQRLALEHGKDVTTVFCVKGLARFKATFCTVLQGVSGVFKRIPYEILGPKELGVPQGVMDLAIAPRGLVLLCGPPHGGKSTVEATIVDRINSERPANIVILEDQVETIHAHKRGTVVQLAVNWEELSVDAALRKVAGQSADVVVVRDLGNRVAMECVLELVRSGYLVIASVCAGSCIDALRRFLITCPSLQRPDGRDAFAADLVAVVCLKLLPRAIGRGRALVTEVLAADREVRSIIRTGGVDRIAAHLKSGSATADSVTLDQALAALLDNRMIHYADAVAHSDDPDEIFRRQQRPKRFGLAALRGFLRRIRERFEPLPSSPWSRESMVERSRDCYLGRRFRGRALAPKINLVRQHVAARSMAALLRVISEEARVQLGIMAHPRLKRPVTMPWHHRDS